MTAGAETSRPIVLGTLIEAMLALDPQAEAISFEGRWYSWGETARTVTALRDSLGALTSGPGTRIGVMLRNRPPQLAALLAVLADDHCLVTINPNYPDATLAQDIADLAVPVLIGSSTDLARAGVARAAGLAALLALPESLGEQVLPAAPLVCDAPHGAPAMIEMLTSGTTGRPKRIALRRDGFEQTFARAVLEETGALAATPRLRRGCRILVAPITHIGGIWGALRWVVSGRRLALLERFSLTAWCEAVERNHPLSVALPPAALNMVLDAAIDPAKLASLQVITAGTAPTDPEVVDAFWSRYGIAVLTNYGATEFAGPVSGWSLADFKAEWAHRRGSVGRLYSGVTARVVDPDDGRQLAIGDTGVLQLRGAQFPEPELWIATTDLARLDEEGFLWILGRTDAAILRGGFKVHPDEVRQALEAYPDVREAAVVGVPDARLGSVPAAAIMLRAGAVLDLEALKVHLRARLLAYQVPAILRVMDDVPRTSAMKPALGELRALLASDAADG